MNPRRTLRLGLLVGIALAVGTGPAAQAMTIDTAAAPVRMGVPVAGEPWSAPAFEVECEAASGQVTCTPTDPGKVTAQRCFINVSLAGESATVCTTYEGHVEAIQADGGRALVVQYGCSLGDAVCLTFENAGRGLALAGTGMMFLVADNMRFDTSTLLWSAAVAQWSFWQWAILIITFGAMVWAVAAAVVSGDRGELVGALVRSFIAVPAVAVTLWLTGHMLNAVDEMTWYILNGDGAAGMYSTLQSVMWAGGQANYFFAFLIHGLLMLGMVLLMLVFAFRNIVLAALIMVGPVAWMLFPVRGIGPQWVVRYVSAVVVLLLTGPLTIGFVSLIVHGLAGVKTIWDPQAWPLLIGLMLVAFAPFALFGLFSFAGAVAADGVGSRLGSHGTGLAGGAARTAARIPTRLGGLPSGIRPTGNRPAATGPGGRSGPQPTSANMPRGATTLAPSRTSTTSSSVRGPSSGQSASPPRPPSTPAGLPPSPRPNSEGSTS